MTTPAEPTEPQSRESRPSQIIVRHQNRRIFLLLAILGLALIVAEIIASFLMNTKMNGMRTLVESIIGFVGFYGLDPKEMRDAGTLVYTWTSGIMTIIRTGKNTRSTDAPGTVVVTQVTPVPAETKNAEDLG